MILRHREPVGSRVTRSSGVEASGLAIGRLNPDQYEWPTDAWSSGGLPELEASDQRVIDNGLGSVTNTPRVRQIKKPIRRADEASSGFGLAGGFAFLPWTPEIATPLPPETSRDFIHAITVMNAR